MYQEGQGAAQDLKKAADMYIAAADQRNSGAHFRLALIYHGGLVAHRDDASAVQHR